MEPTRPTVLCDHVAAGARGSFGTLGRRNNRLQIFGAKTGTLGDAREHLWTEFVVVVEGEYEIWPARVTERTVGT